MARLISSAALAVMTVLAAGCAPTADTGVAGDSAAARPERQCFNADQVRNFRQGASGQLYVRAMRDQVFELNTSGGCMDLDAANRLAITADPMVGSRICTGDWARITLPGSASPVNTCRARVERILSAEEVAALPAAHRP